VVELPEWFRRFGWFDGLRKGNLMSSLERVQDFHRVVKRAEDKLAAAKTDLDVQMLRFKTRLEEAIEDNPQLLLTNAWLHHHARNTLEWSADRVAAAIGCSREKYIMETYR
jgi:predicted transcriptional regulator